MAVVVPVHRNAATLGELHRRVGAALDPGLWRLRLVVDACPAGSLEVARQLARADERVTVTTLAVNVGQHAALRRGLLDEPAAAAWVLLDGDLQDPPEAVPGLLSRLGPGAAAVFAARTGSYQGAGRTLTGRLHRAALSAMTGLPAGAGAFVALDRRGRAAVLGLGGPSVVAALGVSGLPVAAVPVARAHRPEAAGRSSWSSARRLGQAGRTLAWTALHSHRWSSTAVSRPGKRPTVTGRIPR